jgi:hypothetical protein
MRRLSSILVVPAVLAAALGTCAAADPQKILSDGTVHRIQVESRSSMGNETGTSLRHVTQAADGGLVVRTVPGTDDEAVESAPVLDVDPNDNSLILVWVRDEGGIRELRASRFRGGAWGAPLPVAGSGRGAASPRLVVTRDWIHLVWTEPAAWTRVPWRGVYRHADFSIAFGPEALPREVGTTGVSEGGSSSGPDWGQVYVSLYLPGGFPGSPGSVHVWGIRDEPVPIGYHQGHGLPPEIRDVQDLDAAWIGGSLTYWFHDPARFVYRSNRKGTWGPFRVVLLDQETSPESALLQMIEMLRRR